MYDDGNYLPSMTKEPDVRFMKRFSFESDEDGLHNQIAHDPKEPLHSSILADYLDDRGHPAKAGLIRVSVHNKRGAWPVLVNRGDERAGNDNFWRVRASANDRLIQLSRYTPGKPSLHWYAHYQDDIEPLVEQLLREGCRPKEGDAAEIKSRMDERDKNESQEPKQFMKYRAPAGGFISGNLFYPGGKLLPLEATGQQPKKMSHRANHRHNPLVGKSFLFTSTSGKVVKFAKNEQDAPKASQVLGMGFSSPNRGKLDVGDAERKLDSSGHENHAWAVQEALESEGIKPEHYRLYHAIGDWGLTPESAGAENSVVHAITHPISIEKLHKIASRIGKGFHQLAVLSFAHDEKGNEALHRLYIPRGASLDQIREQLTQHGINYRTLVPAPNDAHVLFVSEPYGIDPDVSRHLETIAQEIGDGNVDTARGHAKFVGDESEGRRWNKRKSRQVYNRILKAIRG